MAWWGLFVCCPGQEDEAVCESDRVGPGPEGIGSFRWGGCNWSPVMVLIFLRQEDLTTASRDGSQ